MWRFSRAERVARTIQAEVHQISGSQDHQHSSDVVTQSLRGSGGACTGAFLTVMRRSKTLTWVEFLRQMRIELASMNYDQIPELTSSQPIDLNKPMLLVPKHCPGRKRAVLVGINYVGQPERTLHGCHNDVKNMKRLLEDEFDFDEILVLLDDGIHQPPTKANIEASFRILCKHSKSGDAAFVHFSGHGGREVDLDGDESDGFDSTILPVDFDDAGCIVDDDILKLLVQPMAKGVFCTALFDACHSGTVLDLPYRFTADDAPKPPQISFEHGLIVVLFAICVALIFYDPIKTVVALLSRH